MSYPLDPIQSLIAGPPLGFRFSVFFFFGGDIPNPLDTRFKKVSGIGSSVSTRALNEGGQNLFTQLLPDKVQYEKLVLERGLAVGSPLAVELNVTMSLFEFNPSNVLVSLLDESGLAINSWLFLTAFPVKWTISPLDADLNQAVIETLELSFQRMQSIRL
ncbi:MAG: phage tail protein [Methylococcaceae bacterium]|nr:phage tail protein [Methylococcaceae bacterium]